jgi:hypothetical protein
MRNPVQRGHRFQRKADSIPVITDSGVNAGEKLHRLAGAKLHHGGVGGSWGGICGTDDRGSMLGRFRSTLAE